MKKIKVLHVVLSLGTGGLENGIVNTINGSDQERFKIDVVCLRELGELGERISNPGSKVYFDSSLASGLLNSIKAIRNVHQLNHYDVIHTHGWATMLAGYLAGLLEKDVIVINGEHGTLYYKTVQQRIIQRFLFNRMKINLSVSAALVNEVSRKFKVNRNIFRPILNGVNTQRFCPDQQRRQQIRKEISISDEQLVVGSVGRLVTVKNYPSLIKAFKLIAERVPNALLLFAGDGPNREKLEELTQQQGLKDKVKFLGRRDDIPSVMNAYDVFVLPSYREGLSNTILEAMSSGLPAIVSNVGGSPEIVIEGKTGYLFEVDDIEQISSKIIHLFEDSEMLREFSNNAREHVVKNYSLETMVNNYQNVYQELIDSAEGIH